MARAKANKRIKQMFKEIELDQLLGSDQKEDDQQKKKKQQQNEK